MAVGWNFPGMGASSNWSISGEDIVAADGTLSWDGANEADMASLTGFAATIFDGDTDDDTDCTAQFFVCLCGEPGGFEFRIKGGDWVFVPVARNGAVAVSCRSGSGSGFDLRGMTGGNGVAYISGLYLTSGHPATATVRLGPNLVTNGDFSDGDTGWTVPEGWTVAGGTATSDGAEENMPQDIGAIEGHTYRVDFGVVDWQAMFARVAVGGTACTGVQHDGGASADIVAGSSGLLELLGLSYSGGLTGISAREIL